MAVTILGNGIAPVTGSREFDPLGGGSSISISGVPLANQVAVWTGGSTLKGEVDLTYNGATLTYGGTEFTVSTGVINIPTIPSWSGSEARVVIAEDTSGTLKVNASGGGTANFLLADGSWTTPPINSSGSGLTTTSKRVSLGGSLTANTTLAGASTYSFAATGLTTAEIEAGTSSKLSFATGGNEKSLTLAGSSMLVTDTEDTKGMQYAADYSTNGSLISSGRWIPDKAYVDGAISAQVSSIATGYLVARGELLYTNPNSAVNIVSLPANSIIWDIKVYVSTIFDDSGINSIHIGTGTVQTRYEDSSSILTGTGFRTLTLSNIEDYMSGTTQITTHFIDGVGDATTGQAYVYIIYSTFS
jgi:hypothetical protein